jgi:hypothetical protein
LIRFSLKRKTTGKAIVPTGRNVWRNPKPIIQAYLRIHQTAPSSFSGLPELHVVYSPQDVYLPPIPEPIQSKVKLHTERLSERNTMNSYKNVDYVSVCPPQKDLNMRSMKPCLRDVFCMLSPIDAFRELQTMPYGYPIAESLPIDNVLEI